MGSPPPTRGTLEIVYPNGSNIRITPAYAGNTDLLDRWDPRFQDHPRLRGEHFWQGFRRQRILGSPPPTRGTQEPEVKKTYLDRITPAYAGNTMRKISPRSLPHGSPPPTRGTLYLYKYIHYAIRITPAYAGNTIYPLHPIKHRQDHPRLRGEHLHT